MKNLFFGLIATAMFTSLSFAQSFKGENTSSSIESFAVKSESNSIVTEVKITNKETGVLLPSFIYTFTSDSKSNVKEDLERNSKDVSGTFTIQVDNQLVYQIKVVKGVFQIPEKFEFTGTTEAGRKYPCTIKGNIECAVDRINDMNWFDYGVCLLTAPECLAQTHISCAIDNC